MNDKNIKRLNKPELLKNIKQAQVNALKAKGSDHHELLQEKLKQIVDPNRFGDIFEDYTSQSESLMTENVKATTSKRENLKSNQNTIKIKSKIKYLSFFWLHANNLNLDYDDPDEEPRYKLRRIEANNLKTAPFYRGPI